MWLERAQGKNPVGPEAEDDNGNRAVSLEVCQLSEKEVPCRREDERGPCNDYTVVIGKRLDEDKVDSVSQTLNLRSEATFEDLLELLASCWQDHGLTTIVLREKPVTDLKQRLRDDHGIDPRSLLIVSEVIYGKLPGGMPPKK